MKKFNILITLACLLSMSLSGEARNLWAFLSYSTFNSPQGPYVETYLSVAANSVRFVKNENGTFQATVNVLMTFKQDNIIKAFKKYELKSNEIRDTLKLDFHFLDQQRIAVPNGTYDFEIQLSDQNRDIPATPFIQKVVVDFPSDKPVFSGIQLVKSFTPTDSVTQLTKSGYDLVPYTYTFYPESENKVIFYCELYNMDRAYAPDYKFLVSYYIESFESNLKLSDFTRTKKELPKPVNVILAEMALENLASGNYNLVMEVRNQQNEVITSRKLFFQRINTKAQVPMADIQTTETMNTFVEKMTNADTLREFINSTYPIATGLEKVIIREQMKKADVPTMQRFLYSFWFQRDPTNPELSFTRYRQQVYIAQTNFGTPVKRGYQTDRGRVFLQYGPPNTRSTVYNEPSNYPYEIWQYYTLSNNQSNKKFVFYTRDIVTNDFVLLHSDATGEIMNPRWQVDLRNRIYSTLDIGDTQVINAWGDMQNDYWELPN